MCGQKLKSATRARREIPADVFREGGSEKRRTVPRDRQSARCERFASCNIMSVSRSEATIAPRDLRISGERNIGKQGRVAPRRGIRAAMRDANFILAFSRISDCFCPTDVIIFPPQRELEKVIMIQLISKAIFTLYVVFINGFIYRYL